MIACSSFSKLFLFISFYHSSYHSCYNSDEIVNCDVDIQFNNLNWNFLVDRIMLSIMGLIVKRFIVVMNWDKVIVQGAFKSAVSPTAFLST